MSLMDRKASQAGGQRVVPVNPAFYPPVHPAARRGGALGDANRPSQQRPELSRPAVGHSTYAVVELRAGSGGSSSGALSSGNTSTSRGVGGGVGSHAWLPACVRHIVTAVGQQGRGPMLQLVYSSRGSSATVQHRFETIPVSPSVADNPSRWNEFSDHVRSRGATGLVLVRPIASPDQHCVYAAAVAGTPATGSPAQGRPLQPTPTPTAAACAPCGPAAGSCSDTQQCNSTDGASPASARARDVDVISGQVGECCGADPGEERGRAASAPAPAQGQHAGAPEAAAALAAAQPVGRGSRGGSGPGPGPSCVDSRTQYFGLVVQGSAPSEADGCWVLKTTRSDLGNAPGLCSCTHFSLTRVCLGTPLYSQLRDAWLVR